MIYRSIIHLFFGLEFVWVRVRMRRTRVCPVAEFFWGSHLLLTPCLLQQAAVVVNPGRCSYQTLALLYRNHCIPRSPLPVHLKVGALSVLLMFFFSVDFFFSKMTKTDHGETRSRSRLPPSPGWRAPWRLP